ncbi:MAG: hypothetical protein U1C74_20035 [Phenylobacterium sp.]|nr:hypothetical protein [Phenylobacterium sp.]
MPRTGLRPGRNPGAGAGNEAKDPPGCVTCGLNNYDPNAYDAPGRLFYLRLSYRQ